MHAWKPALLVGLLARERNVTFLQGTGPSVSAGKDDDGNDGRGRGDERTLRHLRHETLRHSGLSQRKSRSSGFSMRQANGQNLRATAEARSARALAAAHRFDEDEGRTHGHFSKPSTPSNASSRSFC